MEQFSSLKKEKAAEEAKNAVKKNLTERLVSECEGFEDKLEYHEIMEALEKELIIKALERSGGSRAGAAKILGLPRNTLKYRLDKFNL